MGNQQVDTENPPELPSHSQVDQSDQQAGDHADNRADIGNQVGDPGNHPEDRGVADVGEGEPHPDNDADDQGFEDSPTDKMCQLPADMVINVEHHLEVAVRCQGNQATHEPPTVAQKKEGKERDQ